MSRLSTLTAMGGSYCRLKRRWPSVGPGSVPSPGWCVCSTSNGSTTARRPAPVAAGAARAASVPELASVRLMGYIAGSGRKHQSSQEGRALPLSVRKSSHTF